MSCRLVISLSGLLPTLLTTCVMDPLDLMSTSGQMDDDLREIKITPWSWSDLFLVVFRLILDPLSSQKWGQTKLYGLPLEADGCAGIHQGSGGFSYYRG